MCLPVFAFAMGGSGGAAGGGAASGGVTGKSLGLFPCTGVVDPKDPTSKECTFQDVLSLANNIIKALFFAIMLISPLLIAHAGYLFIISSSNPKERDRARNRLLNIVIGLVIVACSYGVVKLVLSVLLKPTTITTFF